MEPRFQMSATYDGTRLDANLDRTAYSDLFSGLDYNPITCSVERRDGVTTPLTFAVCYDDSIGQPGIERSQQDGAEVYTMLLDFRSTYELSRAPIEVCSEGITFKLKLRD